MSSNKCSRCEQTVYPVEGLRCLDKIWHKGCFKCQECNMTLSLKNYKGFEKKPYCNAHCPQAKATTVVDTPEQRRLAENTRIQSQAKYHEDFEKSKGKITAIADDPETVRLKQTSKIISNVAYHGELERKKQMEEKRKPNGSDEDFIAGLGALSISSKGHTNNHGKQSGNNNNHTSSKHNNALPSQSSVSGYPEVPIQNQQSVQQQQPSHQNYHKQQHNPHQKEILLLKQKQHQQITKPQQQHQIVYSQEGHNGQQQGIHQPMGQQSDGLAQHPLSHQNSQAAKMHMMQQQQHLHNHHHGQQQLAMRQSQMMMQQQNQHQQHRLSLENAAIMNNQPISKQYSNPQMAKHQQPLMSIQQHPNAKYMPMNEPSGYHHQPSPTHLIGAQMISPAHMANGHRMPIVNGPPPAHVLHSQQMIHHMNSGLTKQKQQQQQMIHMPQQAVNQRPIVHHPSQIHHPDQHHQLLMHQQPQHIRPMMMQQQMPRRVFKAMYDYVANDVDEVSFFENDILIDCVNVDGNWLMGKVARSGQTGMLPANYVAEFSSR